MSAACLVVPVAKLVQLVFIAKCRDSGSIHDIGDKNRATGLMVTYDGHGGGGQDEGGI